MIATLIIRGLQIIFAAVVLALSVVLIKDYGPGSGPSLYQYGAFVGGAGIVFAAVGIVACFFESLQGIAILVLDALATLFTLAGGIAYAAKLGVGSCGDKSTYGYLADHLGIFAPSNNKIYPGAINKNGDYDEGKLERAILNDLTGRCREAQATTAFVWFMFACFAATLALVFMAGKGRGRGSMV